jgi:hypothetical protein
MLLPETATETADQTDTERVLRVRRMVAKPLHSGGLRKIDEQLGLIRENGHGVPGGEVFSIQAVFAPDNVPPGFCVEPGELLDGAVPVPIVSPRDYRHSDQVVDSLYEGLVAFQSASQEKAEAEHLAKLEDRKKKLKRRAERAKVVVATETEAEREKRLKAEADGKKWVERNCALAKEAADRLDNGFYFPGGHVAGERYSRFLEKNLRSRCGSPSMFRYLQCIPRAKGMRVGSDKEAVLPVLSKALGTDAPYIQLDPRFARIIAIELDGVFSSIEALYKALLDIFGARMMPNLIVGRPDRNGDFARPHLIWLLNPETVLEDGRIVDSSVWLEVARRNANGEQEGDKRCRKKIVGFYRQVIRGLKMLLLPLGADVGFQNLLKPKNPLSPFWTTVVANDDYWPTLTDFFSVKNFRINVTDDELRDEVGILRGEADGATRKQSNHVWNTVGEILNQDVRYVRETRLAGFVMAALQSEDALTRWLKDRIRPSVEIKLGDDLAEDEKAAERLERVLERRCRFAAKLCSSRWNDKRKTRCRGRDRDVKLTVDSAAERRHIASERSGDHRHQVELYKMRKAISCELMGGRSLTKTELILKECVATRSFAYKHWAEAIAGLGSIEFHDGSYRYIGGTNNHSVRPEDTTSTGCDTLLSGSSTSVIVDSIDKPPPITGPDDPDPDIPGPSTRKRVLTPAESV